MFKVTVQSRIDLPIIKELIAKYISEFYIIDRRPLKDYKNQTLVKIILKDSNISAVEDAIKKLPGVSKFAYHAIDRKTIFARIVGKPMAPFLNFQDCNCVLHKASFKEDILTQVVFIQSKACLGKRLQEFCKNNKVLGISYEPVHLSVLTVKQSDILQKAYGLGYFDFPKKIGVRELAKLSGVSTATVLETLKCAERKVLKKYFE